MVSLLGTVTRLSSFKTVSVAYPKLQMHKEVGKILKRKILVTAHDARSICGVGDKVVIQNLFRPIGKNKRWVVVGLAQSAGNLSSIARQARAAKYIPVRGRKTEEIRLQLPRPKDMPRGSRAVRY